MIVSMFLLGRLLWLFLVLGRSMSLRGYLRRFVCPCLRLSLGAETLLGSALAVGAAVLDAPGVAFGSLVFFD